MRQFVYSLTSFAALAMMFQGTAFGQDAPLEHFTKDVGVVVRLKSFDKTLEKVVGLVDQVQEGAGSFVEQRAPEIGVAIANPTLTGVDQSRDWYVGIYPNETNPPIVVFVVPATETADMVDALGEGFTTSIEGTWVVYTEAQYEIPKAERSDSAVSLMGEEVMKTFDKGDLSIFVNVGTLTKIYESQIETGQEQILEQLNNLRFAMPEESGINMGAIVDMYGAGAESFFQGLKDAESFTSAISISPESGVTIDDYLVFDAASESGKALTGTSANEMPLISKLPEGAVVYYGLSGGIKEFMNWSMDMSASMLKDDAAREKLKVAMEKFNGIDFGSMVVGINIGSLKGGLVRVSGVAEASPIDAARTAMREVTQLSSNMEFPGFKQEADIQIDAETYGDNKADLVKIKQEYEEGSDQAELQKKMQEIMFGEAGMETRVLYMKDAYLTTMGGGKEAMTTLVARQDSSRSNGVDGVRQLMLEKANFIGMFDLASMVAQGTKAASSVEGFPLPVDEQMIDNLNIAPSYIGASVASEPNSVRARCNVPVIQMQSIGKIAALFTALQMQL